MNTVSIGRSLFFSFLKLVDEWIGNTMYCFNNYHVKTRGSHTKFYVVQFVSSNISFSFYFWIEVNFSVDCFKTNQVKKIYEIELHDYSWLVDFFHLGAIKKHNNVLWQDTIEKTHTANIYVNTTRTSAYSLYVSIVFIFIYRSIFHLSNDFRIREILE